LVGGSIRGRTKVAEVLARELRLSLYRIDLSAMVRKYIDETEKNLRSLFDAAEHSRVLLFFDEADALFGKRTEVKDAHDRHANIGLSLLLERIEIFSGLVIVATNRCANSDEILTRRLGYRIELPNSKDT